MPILHEKINYSVTMRKSSGHGRPFEHWHQRGEFVYILEGQCLISIGKEQCLCGPGDLAVVRSGEIHTLSGTPNCVDYISTFDPAMFYQFFSEPQFPQHFISAQEQKQAGLDGEIARLLHGIYQEAMAEKPLYETVMRADILRLYSLLIRHFKDDQPGNEKSMARLQQLQTALEFIADHYAEHITLADVAGAMGYTSSYVSTLFVACTGVNFKNYLDHFRIKKAVDLLCSTRQTVTDIAIRCGYDNVRTFNNAFHRVTGQSPSQLRKNNT